MQSSDFTDAGKYPDLEFKSKLIEIIDEAHRFIYGDLTMCNLTREIVLDAEYAGMVKSPWGITNSGFSAKTQINHKHRVLTGNVALVAG